MQTNFVKMVENETIKISKAIRIIHTKAIRTSQDIHRPIATKAIKILNLTRAFVNCMINKVTLLKDARTSTMLLLLDAFHTTSVILSQIWLVSTCSFRSTTGFHHQLACGLWGPHHVTADKKNLSLHSDYDGSEDIMIGAGIELPIICTGSTTLPLTSRSFVLSDVLCVLSLKKKSFISF